VGSYVWSYRLYNDIDFIMIRPGYDIKLHPVVLPLLPPLGRSVDELFLHPQSSGKAQSTVQVSAERLMTG
jgi:hypothetical protein